ncbi:glycosyltransferase [Neisseria iguanae]|uniref:Glycosyltransferase family 4 protein n=1 Tax=Neisseria iguanae TaxID=90242 RepID=A0A2P7U057_9NEIS|nr:glycosyltransferase [Neisseria iguanae]PSJ80366.1 glycosyltransferase family 4 protein [Neisseria iguanae]
MHIVVIPSWYPKSEQDIDGIFFKIQAQGLQKNSKIKKVGVVAPMFRFLRSQPETIFSGPYGINKHRHGGLNTYIYDSMYFFPRCPIVDIDRIRWVKAGLKAFKAYIQENGRPDVIHAHAMNYAGILASEIFKQFGIPYVITEHSSTYARNLIRTNQWPAMREAAKHASALYAVSRDFVELLNQKYPGTQWTYLPNVLGRNFTEPFEFKEQSDGEFIFCSVSHLRHLKGHDLLLPAFAKALQKYPHLKLKIGGDGPEAGNLNNLAAQLGITDSVTFLGALKTDEVLHVMRQSDAFVLASRTETFGVVYIEALSQGLPVIATKCGGPQSIVRPENGFLIPTGNIDELADALIQMYENRDHFSPKKLRQDCLAEFSEEAVINQLIAKFENIVG